jgi:hypothetical protein
MNPGAACDTYPYPIQSVIFCCRDGYVVHGNDEAYINAQLDRVNGIFDSERLD